MLKPRVFSQIPAHFFNVIVSGRANDEKFNRIIFFASYFFGGKKESTEQEKVFFLLCFRCSFSFRLQPRNRRGWFNTERNHFNLTLFEDETLPSRFDRNWIFNEYKLSLHWRHENFMIWICFVLLGAKKKKR